MVHGQWLLHQGEHRALFVGNQGIHARGQQGSQVLDRGTSEPPQRKTPRDLHQDREIISSRHQGGIIRQADQARVGEPWE